MSDDAVFSDDIIEAQGKRIAELKKVLQAMIDNLEADIDYRGMNIKSYCPLCGEVSYDEFSPMQEIRHEDTCPWGIAKGLLSKGGADE